jgi:hypothetical protein
MNNSKPERKRMRKSSSTSNMDQLGQHVESPNRVDVDNYAEIFKQISLLRQDQAQVKQSVESKIDTLIREIPTQINAVIETKMNSLKDDLSKTLKNFDARISAVERQVTDLSQKQNTPKLLKYCERCVIANGIHYEQSEDLLNKVGRLLFDLGPNIVQNTTVVAAERLNSRNPPLVKVAFLTPEDKIEVLRAKQSLANSKEFGQVRIWSSKSHCERLLENNM